MAYAFPAQYDLAMMHRNANMFGYNPTKIKGKDQKEVDPAVCACCGI